MRLRAESRSFGLSIEGLPGEPIRDVVLRRVTIAKAATPARITETDRVRSEAVMINGAPWSLEASVK